MNIRQNISPLSLGLGIFVLILVEFILFREYILREIISYYPTNFDQAGYLAQSYTVYENAISDGLFKQFKSNSMFLATSYAFMPQTVLAYLLFGASRFTAFATGFIYFAILQILLVRVAANLTGQRSFAILLLGLFLCTTTLFYWAGSLFDFRIDFMAMCLFGIVVTCALQSNLFLNIKWTIITVLFSACLILLRYITATYLIGIYLSFFAYLLAISYLKSRQGLPSAEFKQRAKHLCFALLGMIIILSPFVWTGWEAFYHYYVDNHFLTKEKYIRATQVGVKNLMTALIYYPKSVISEHIGSRAYYLILISLLGIWGLDKYIYKLPNQGNKINNLILPFLILCILVPIAILTMDYSKSPVVGNITVIPILWLTVWIVFIIYSRTRASLLKHFIVLVAAISLILGISHFIKTTGHHSSATQRKNLQQITQMYIDIGDYLHAKNCYQAIFSMDRIADYLVVQALTVLYYEKKGILFHPGNTRMGSTLYELNQDEALTALRNSDVFIVNQETYPKVRDDYPFNQSMNLIRPMLRNTAEHEFIKLGDYTFNNYQYRVYIKK